jgi:hypothetical protein
MAGEAYAPSREQLTGYAATIAYLTLSSGRRGIGAGEGDGRASSARASVVMRFALWRRGVRFVAVAVRDWGCRAVCGIEPLGY